MPTLTAEVTGNYDQQHDANGLLYAPLETPATYRRTRVYVLDYEGSEDDARAFVRRTLLDEVAEEVHFGGEPALANSAFYLDVSMRPGALDLEKEAILASHRGARNKAIEITTLKLTQRTYIFSDADPKPDRFVRDVCNPAVHTWSVTDSAA